MDSKAAAFTSSVNHDKRLIEPVIMINIAHVLSLTRDGVLDAETGVKILDALRSAPTNLQFDPSLEDVHMNVEEYVLKASGEAGGFLNLGKSRNDQVSTALRIVTRDEILKIVGCTLNLVDSILRVAAENINLKMPGYTHLQVAQPTTVAHYLLCYAEALLRDSQRLIDCYDRVNLSPMGAAAFSGTTVPVNRKTVAKLLGFDGIVENSMDAVSSRDFIIEFLAGALITQLDLSRFAEDMIFFSSQEASYIDPPDELSSTSSIMPQKKNQVVLEIVRAKAGTILGYIVSSAAILKGLPQSYNLDLQEFNSNVWKASDDLTHSLELLAKFVSGVKFRKEALERGATSGFSAAAELAEYLTIKLGLPFRTSHHIVGAVASNLPQFYTFDDVKALLVKEARVRGISIAENQLPASYEVFASIPNKKTIGSPSPAQVKLMMNNLKKETTRIFEWIEQRRQNLRQASKALALETDRIIKEVRKKC